MYYCAVVFRTWFSYTSCTMVTNSIPRARGSNRGACALWKGARPTFVAVVGLTLHTGAYLSEIFRAALQSVPKGQMEAAQAIGMTWFQAFRRIVLPQATVFALPLFTNQFLNTMKSTSIVFVITVIELLRRCKVIYRGKFTIFWGLHRGGRSILGDGDCLWIYLPSFRNLCKQV